MNSSWFMIIIFILTIFGLYAIVDRVCTYLELLAKPRITNKEFSMVEDLVNNNKRLVELTEKAINSNEELIKMLSEYKEDSDNDL